MVTSESKTWLRRLRTEHASLIMPPVKQAHSSLVEEKLLQFASRIVLNGVVAVPSDPVWQQLAQETGYKPKSLYNMVKYKKVLRKLVTTSTDEGKNPV